MINAVCELNLKATEWFRMPWLLEANVLIGWQVGQDNGTCTMVRQALQGNKVLLSFCSDILTFESRHCSDTHSALAAKVTSGPDSE